MKHKELRCTLPDCNYDMRKDPKTKLAVERYLEELLMDIEEGKILHISVSVHREEKS